MTNACTGAAIGGLLILLPSCGRVAVDERPPADAAADAPSEASPVDSGVTLADAVVDAPASTPTCGFELTGSVRASVTGTGAAFSAGTEIPFLRFECMATGLGVDYELFGDYIPGDSSLSLFVGSTNFYGDRVCPIHAVFTGAAAGPEAYGDGGYAVGQRAALTFDCGGLVNADVDGGEPLVVGAAWLDATVMDNEASELGSAISR
jgi:hypothetical protein